MSAQQEINLLQYDSDSLLLISSILNPNPLLSAQLEQLASADRDELAQMANVAYGILVSPEKKPTEETVDGLNLFTLSAVAHEFIAQLLSTFDLLSLNKEQLKTLKERAESADMMALGKACSVLILLFNTENLSVNPYNSKYQAFAVPRFMTNDFVVEKNNNYGEESIGGKLSMVPRKNKRGEK